MSGTLDSKAYFDGRLAFLELAEFAPKFKEKGWVTVNAFAYSNSYVPGRADESALAEKVFKHIFGTLDHAKEHAARRLFTECHIMCTSETQRMMARPDEEGKAPRKLPIEERGQRWDDMEKEFPLLNLEGQLEPSHALVDKYVEMEERNELTFLKWEEFTMRDQEERGVKKLALWAEDGGHLVRYYKDIEIFHQSEDRMDLWFALQRRGLSMQVGRLLSFPVHQKLIDYYFAEMGTEPIDPERFAKIKLTQVFNADRQIFILMGKATKKGFKHLGNIAAKEYPLDKIFETARSHPKVVQLMLPHPIASGSSQTQEPRNEKKRPAADNQQINQLMQKIKKLEQANAKGKGDQSGKGYGNGKDKNKGKGKGNGGHAKKDRGINMPKELIGMLPNIQGQKLCFLYNMKQGCKVSGQDGCDKGAHLCCHPTCEEQDRKHSVQRCPAYAKQVMKAKGY